MRGTKKEAQAELIRLLAAGDNGTSVDPSKVTVAEYVRAWLDGAEALSGKTREQYRQLAEQQIIPHLGTTTLQKLRPAQIQDWHTKLQQAGGLGGRALSARTVGHAHPVLHAALARAANVEVVARNVAAVVRPPKVEALEVQILTASQVADVLPGSRTIRCCRWRRLVIALGLPAVMLHSLRHTHASALIAGGVDVLTISRRLGHETPAFTQSAYGHLFRNTDAEAARTIEAAFGAM